MRFIKVAITGEKITSPDIYTGYVFFSAMLPPSWITKETILLFLCKYTQLSRLSNYTGKNAIIWHD